MKNQGLKNHQRSNRIRRIGKRVIEIQADIASEIMRAAKLKRDPAIADFYAHINRLQSRLAELVNV